MDMERLMENAKAGREILTHLNELSDSELKKIIATMVDNSKVDEVLSDCSCTRKIRNSVVEEIGFHNWSSVEINTSGIYYKPEHGSSEKVFPFSKHITLNLK